MLTLAITTEFWKTKEFAVKVLIMGLMMMMMTQTGGAEDAPGLLHFKSGGVRLNLVELYSSEGCSSCPPAERWLKSLREEKKLWRNFVPVEFHVDYWDQLGWKDPYASPEYTQRQKNYADLWGNQNIYTPGVVLNGLEWADWRTGHALSSLEGSGGNKGDLDVIEISPRKFVVRFSPNLNLSDFYSVNATLLGNGLSSNVTRGENSGENLRHDFVVLSFKTALLKKDGTVYSATVDLSKERVDVQPKSFSVAFWVTDHTQRPIQAAGGDLTR